MQLTEFDKKKLGSRRDEQKHFSCCYRGKTLLKMRFRILQPKMDRYFDGNGMRRVKNRLRYRMEDKRG